MFCVITQVPCSFPYYAGALFVFFITQVPSVFIAAHMLMGSQVLRCVAEAFRRSPPIPADSLVILLVDVTM